jgi:hypothetical protein
VDPQGWTAGLRHLVDDRYRLTSSSTFVGALRLAVLRMRLTNLPVALAVARGNHGWVLHGFTATADPAQTTAFKITSVRVSGPLWGLQNSTFGYDMPPNKKLAPYELKRFFTPWWYAPKRMIWDGRFVSIQPVPFRSSTVSASTTPSGPAAARVITAPPVEPRAPIPSSAVMSPPKVAVSAPTTTDAPTATGQPLPVADLALVLVSGGLAVLVLLVSRIGRSGSPGRPGSRLKDPHAGWSS